MHASSSSRRPGQMHPAAVAPPPPTIFSPLFVLALSPRQVAGCGNNSCAGWWGEEQLCEVGRWGAEHCTSSRLTWQMCGRGHRAHLLSLRMFKHHPGAVCASSVMSHPPQAQWGLSAGEGKHLHITHLGALLSH